MQEKGDARGTVGIEQPAQGTLVEQGSEKDERRHDIVPFPILASYWSQSYYRPAPTLTMPVQRTSLPERNLDVLRAVAVLGVLCDHAAGALGHSSPFTDWLGGAGVQSFFVHTCLVLMASMERDGAPERQGWVRRFYVRRAFRIYPLAWVVIAIVFVLHVPPSSMHSAYEPISRSTLLANLALAQNLVARPDVLIVLWTLPVELQMYVVLPLCFLVARLNSRAGMFALLAAGVVCASVFAWGIDPAHPIRYLSRLNVLRFVPSFLMGTLAYWLLRRRASGDEPLAAWIWLPFLLLNITLFYFPRRELGARWFVLASYCAVVGLMIPLVKDARDSWFTRGAHVIATYSYGIYLVHLLALRVGFVVLADWPVVAQCVVSAVVLAVGCWIAFHAIEKPGIALGRRLAGGRGTGDTNGRPSENASLDAADTAAP